MFRIPKKLEEIRIMGNPEVRKKSLFLLARQMNIDLESENKDYSKGWDEVGLFFTRKI